MVRMASFRKIRLIIAGRGQVRDVYVYRLIGAGSLEELIYSRREYCGAPIKDTSHPSLAELYKQHQAEIAYDAAAPSRMFAGVQDDRKNQGELFGLVRSPYPLGAAALTLSLQKNLFRFNPTSNRLKNTIQDAQISELGFALMNHTGTADAGSKKKKKKGSEDSEDETVSQDENGLVGNNEVDLACAVFPVIKSLSGCSGSSPER